MTGYTVFRSDALEFATPSGGDQRRGIVRLSDAMTQMRGNVWRLPPGTRGRRHVETVQEEVFVALDGEPSLFLGDPPERVVLPRGSFAVVPTGTAIQVANDGGDDAVILILGAPPETGRAEYLPDA